ncbi:M1 family metallopeptidase [Hymenobacter rubripertinctus]|uniref:M1 family peptidase n=1 Tax=Hymenobacter rubripertinctus TaxID=2029981 RepID=A0A418QUK7_9BACT|nr:M1 family metallopeptidase [Hymenobacter rubripertinctus]RIY08798.1 M1 family peptidase [Hymenobacter rubripertinctus]
MKKILYLFSLLTLPALAQKPAAGWQQQTNYSIDVALDDQRHQLTGREQIVYTNNSPDALPYLWFHLWPNAYRDNHTAFARQQLRNNHREFQFATPAQRGFIDGLEFQVNGQPARLDYDATHPDMARLMLPQPLAAGASITITTPFRVKIPDSFSRFGHVGQGYQITQWYPKPAVYDHKGWHPMPYLSQGEFYSEFGSFDVRITLPANYVVGATGVLQNPEEQQRLEALAAVGAAKKTAEDFGSDLSYPASASETKTLRYVQDRIHDFAWFADKRYNVLKSGVTLPSGRTVTSWVMFTNKDALDWIQGLQDVNDALTYYSRWVGEYPYASAMAVEGALSAGSGMEYPMVTVTQPAAIVHEVGHNWFYGILGSNERDFAWLDEGVNTYMANRVAERDTAAGGSLGLGLLLRSPRLAAAVGIDGLPTAALEQLPIAASTARGLDQPVGGFASADYSSLNYELIVYGKAPMLLKYLAGYLGQEQFDAAMHAYYAQWQFRHPYPDDMQAVFERVSGQKLGWFFQQMLTTQNHYEAALSDLQVKGETLKVLVRNDSPAPFAVPVSTLDARGQVLETKWTTAFGGTDDDTKDETQLNFRAANVAAVVVDAGYLTPQLNRRDDRMKLTGSLRTWEPLQLRPLASVERWDRQFINWVPVVGANTSDKFMLGAAFYNNLLVPKRLNYLAMPLYSFSRRELNGIGSLTLNVLPHARVRQLLTSVQISRFERYRKIEPSLTLLLPHSAYNQAQHLVRFANTNVRDQDLRQTSSIQTLEYRVSDENALQNWSGHVELNQLTPNAETDNTRQNATLLRATATYGRYYNARKQVRARLFGGAFLNSGNESPFAMGLSGSFDYRRQTMFLDRQQISSTYAAQLHQTDDRDGGFKAYLPVATRKWLTTVGFEADLPITPLVVFADFGLANRAGQSGSDRTAGYYDGGLVLPVSRILVPIPNNVLRLYLPLAGSQYGNGLPGSRKEFTDQIRFVFHLEELSPFRLVNQQLSQ